MLKAEIGAQYKGDSKADPSGFLEAARLHQSKFRAETLKVDYDTFGNYLKESDAMNGLNYFNDAVYANMRRRYPGYSKQRDANMLRSEHMPFNLFVPLQYNQEVLTKVLSHVLGYSVTEITDVRYEYAPRPKIVFLNDATAFDTYIAYESPTGNGFMGIEVKYTERAYPLKKGSSEEAAVLNRRSRYFQVMNKCKRYKPGVESQVIEDEFRQVWRNHLLGESLVLENPDESEQFHSITMYPEGNKHFRHVIPAFQEFMLEGQKNVLGLTLESFIQTVRSVDEENELSEWLDYLNNRYIIS